MKWFEVGLGVWSMQTVFDYPPHPKSVESEHPKSTYTDFFNITVDVAVCIWRNTLGNSCEL